MQNVLVWSPREPAALGGGHVYPASGVRDVQKSGVAPTQLKPVCCAPEVVAYGPLQSVGSVHCSAHLPLTIVAPAQVCVKPQSALLLQMFVLELNVWPKSCARARRK